MIFAACVVLFFAASAAIGPGVAAQVTRRQPDIAALVVAAIILLPQAIVASISPWIGRTAEISGRRPLLVVGWGYFRSKVSCTQRCLVLMRWWCATY